MKLESLNKEGRFKVGEPCFVEFQRKSGARTSITYPKGFSIDFDKDQFIEVNTEKEIAIVKVEEIEGMRIIPLSDYKKRNKESSFMDLMNGIARDAKNNNGGS